MDLGQVGLIAVGALLSIISSTLARWRERTNEHANWLREKRWEAWIDLVVLGHEILKLGSVHAPYTKTLHSEHLQAGVNVNARVAALGPQIMKDKSDDLLNALIAYIDLVAEGATDDAKRLQFDAVGDSSNAFVEIMGVNFKA